MRIVFILGQDTYTVTGGGSGAVPRIGESVSISMRGCQFIEGKVFTVKWFYHESSGEASVQVVLVTD